MGVFLFKKIKLLRKAFLTNFLQFHYSQFGEDIVLREILHKDKVDGFYVDVGCFHPKKFSNTYFLYKLGWKGINIDMEEDKVSLFNLVRPKDINILSAISDINEDVKLYRFDKYGHGSTIDKNFALDTKIPVLDESLIRTKTLNEVLDSSIYKDQQIDILSIDTEGTDYKVLRSLDIVRYRPKIIIIEDHNRNINDIMMTEVFKHLSNYGYVLRSWSFYSLIFILPNSSILKDREKTISI